MKVSLHCFEPTTSNDCNCTCFWVGVWHAHTQPAAAAASDPLSRHRHAVRTETDRQASCRGDVNETDSVSAGTEVDGSSENATASEETVCVILRLYAASSWIYSDYNRVVIIVVFFLLICKRIDRRTALNILRPGSMPPPPQSLQSSGLTLSETSMGRCVQGQRRVCSSLFYYYFLSFK